MATPRFCLEIGGECSARIYIPCFGHKNQHFRENQPKALVFIPNPAQRRHFQRVL
jgi:hypothetical protein